MLKMIYAEPGYEFEPTAQGKKIGKVAAKYTPEYKNPQYRRCVPESWYEQAWVRQKKVI